MAITYAVPNPDPGTGSAGNMRTAVRLVTLDASPGYATGGYVLDQKQFGLSAIRAGSAYVHTATATPGTIANIVVLPQADGSALLKCNALAAEIGNGVSCAGTVVKVSAQGSA